MAIQFRRTLTPNLPPIGHGVLGGLAEGQLAIELASDPARLWVGVRQEVDITGRRQITNVLTDAVGELESGTITIFHQAEPPIGWTRLVGGPVHDRMLRVVHPTHGGVGGSFAGVHGLSIWNAQSVAGNHTVTAAQLPQLTAGGHTTLTVWPEENAGLFIPGSAMGWGYFHLDDPGGGTQIAFPGPQAGTQISEFNGANPVSLATTNAGGGTHAHGLNLDVLYTDVILASKD